MSKAGKPGGVRVIDRGYKGALDRTHALHGSSVKIGLLDDGSVSADGTMSLAAVGSVHEYGSDLAGVPERSFIRSAMDENAGDLTTIQRDAVERVSKGTLTPQVALGRLGLWAQAKIQGKISSNIPPPNAQSTIDAKGSSATLIDSGRMRASIAFAVKLKGGRR